MALWQPLVFLLAILTSAFVSAYTPLSDETLKILPGPGSDFDIKTGALLSPILRTRVPGTEGSRAVQDHFVRFFRESLPNWKIEFHNSTATTPLSNGGQVPFVNIILTRDPPWTQEGEVGRLALVAHYDSKVSPEGFIGAIDSAAPCAMIMHAARSIDGALTRKWNSMIANGEHLDSLEGERGIQIILLDGEEAFVSWTETDSLYGARALAESWEQTYHTAGSTYHNSLSSIELFLLLDLLGSADPTVPSYFKTTHWAYKAMAKLETRLRDLQQLKSSPNHPAKLGDHGRGPEPLWFIEAEKHDARFVGWMVQDDHVPFLERGVEVLHIIPTPFPKVWHEIEDDGEHLDMPTVEDWAKIVMAFAGEWMDLEGHFLPESTRDEAPNDQATSNKHVPKEAIGTRKSELSMPI